MVRTITVTGWWTKAAAREVRTERAPRALPTKVKLAKATRIVVARVWVVRTPVRRARMALFAFPTVVGVPGVAIVALQLARASWLPHPRLLLPRKSDFRDCLDIPFSIHAHAFKTLPPLCIL